MNNTDDPADNLRNYTTVTARNKLSRHQLDHYAQKIAKILITLTDPIVIHNDEATTTLRETARDDITNELGPNCKYWYQFSIAIEAALDQLADKGVLQDIPQYRVAFLAIAQGLQKV